MQMLIYNYNEDCQIEGIGICENGSLLMKEREDN